MKVIQRYFTDRHSTNFIKIGAILSSLGIILFPQELLAQILPDTTLPNNSIVEIEGGLQRITEGSQAGSNLFHSFEQFNLDTGGTAYFDNALTIDNIITRVTGGTISNIDGILRANGSANLFLINPSGIVLGPNARLDIGGSFLGSTADHLIFEDGSVFSATNPDRTAPLLSVNVPIGLQLGPHPGGITLEGPGHGLIAPPIQSASPQENLSDVGLRGLQVPTGRTLSFVGGNVTFNGALLSAPSGRIDIGSAIEGRVNLSGTALGWRLDYPEDIGNFGDIQLSGAAGLDVSGGGGRGIQLVGRRITLSEGSFAFANTQSALAGGDITLRAFESIAIRGTDSGPNGFSSALRTDTIGPGDSGAISVSTPSLTLDGGAGIYTASFGAGNGGNIWVDATDSVELIGASPLRRTALSAIGSNTFNEGDGGDITLSTSRLSLRDGGALLGLTQGTGRGGNVVVRAAEEVEVIGFNRTRPNGTRSSLSTIAQGPGKGGNTTIETARLRLLDGGQVVATTTATGAGGRLRVNASESIEISGVVEGTSLPSTLSSDAPANIPIQQILGLPPIPSGEPGTVTLNTPRLNISDRARVGVDNQGLGNGGDLQITAEAIFLDTGGRIAASSVSGEGGNVVLQVGDTLQLRHGSQITAEAGNRGNGGNISIDTDTLVALENSDITANAQQGLGGRVSLAATGIFGTQFRDFQTPESDITATSQLGAEFSGVVEIQTPDVDPGAGLVQLAASPIDPTTEVTSGCVAYTDSQFIVTGRGGLAEEPIAPIGPETIWEDWRDFSSTMQTTTGTSIEFPVSISTPPALVEATGWQINDAGEVELIATVSSRNRGGAWGERSNCQSQTNS